MKKERNYEFRKRMLAVHDINVRDKTLMPESDEFEITDGICIFIGADSGEVIKTAARDFVDYLFVTMGVSVMLKICSDDAGKGIFIKTGQDLGDYAVYKGYRVNVSAEALEICGFDERGAAQALYNLEDVLNLRKAPFVRQGVYYRKPMYSPCMVHSGYGLDQYPNEHLSRIAHEGRDAILVFVKGVDLTPSGHLDFNELIFRAGKYGIDVYAYSYMKSELHPEEPGAEAYYESSYGRLFESCPGLKGVVLVGESVEFPSEDEHVTGKSWRENAVEGIPTGKISPGWFPCFDYPKWLSLIQRVIYKHKKDADIVLWSYNWGGQAEEDRVKLINALPEGITLQATFEMFESYDLTSEKGYCADYTISFEGFGFYFESEARAAKARGIKLYSMTNSGGLTWDFGTLPYIPVPFQWMKRYRAMEKAHDEWGLAGIMESHHFGFYPSFISKLSKWLFTEPRLPYLDVLEKVLKSEFGTQSYAVVRDALELWSEAITKFTPSDADQYGAFRVGPSYPFCLDEKINMQSAPYAHFGGSICYTHYFDNCKSHAQSFISVRVPEELQHLLRMKELFDKGLIILRGAKNRNEKLDRLINMGEFISCYIQTGIHAKKWYMLKCNVRAQADKQKLADIITEMEGLLKAEIINAEKAIPFVESDSRLGWEPSMEYMTDARQIRWKIRQVQYVLDVEIQRYKMAAGLGTA